MNRAVFLDRDGVVNLAYTRSGKPYPPKDLSQLVILTGVEESVRRLKKFGFVVSSEIYKDNTRTEVIERFYSLRQQGKKGSGLPNLSLADYLAPKESGVADYMGFFAVTAGVNIEPLIAKYEADHDDYNSIMIKSVADRLAEAFAELMHTKVRKELWGYAADETLTNEELIKESYQGIRPAPGYPACPDHTEKPTLFKLLDAQKETGIELS